MTEEKGSPELTREDYCQIISSVIQSLQEENCRLWRKVERLKRRLKRRKK